MVSLDQIRQLEIKVHKAVSLLQKMKEENTRLAQRADAAEVRVLELEELLEAYRSEQSEIENGIIAALEHLDSLESVVGGLKPSPVAPAQAPAAPPAPSAQPEIAASETPEIESHDEPDFEEAPVEHQEDKSSLGLF